MADSCAAGGEALSPPSFSALSESSQHRYDQVSGAGNSLKFCQSEKTGVGILLYTMNPTTELGHFSEELCPLLLYAMNPTTELGHFSEKRCPPCLLYAVNPTTELGHFSEELCLPLLLYAMNPTTELGHVFQ